MSSESWQTRLRATLTPPSKRIAIVGVGNTFNGDDAAGVEVIRQLQRHLPDSPRYLCIDAGTAPENVTGLLCRFAADVVLTIDCAQMNLPPGAIAWIDRAAIGGISASTHTLPLDLFADYLTSETGCEVALIGIQPAATTFDAPLSSSVRQAAYDVARVLQEALQQSG